jgi:hypothetical protein
MKSAEHWLVHEHTQFEFLLRECRAAADKTDWWALDRIFKKLVEQLRFHMAQEEEVIFPAYEKKRESSHMSTLELYNEHSVIVDSFRKLDNLIEERSSKDVYDSIVTLELFMIEHNAKEEKAFLPFASHLLFDDREVLTLKLDEFVVKNESRHWNFS